MATSPARNDATDPGISLPGEPKLERLNLVNLVAFVVNILVPMLYENRFFGEHHNRKDTELFLFSPSWDFLAILLATRIMDLVWTIAQLLPAYQNHQLVVTSVGYKFSLATLGQFSWMIAHQLLNLNGLSVFLAVGGVLWPVWYTVEEISKIPTAPLEYWLLKFAFELRAGWVIVVTLVNIDFALPISEGPWVVLELVKGLFLLGIVGYGGYHYTNRRVWTVPCVVVVAMLSITANLFTTIDTIADTTVWIVRTMQVCTIVVSVGLSAWIVVKLRSSRMDDLEQREQSPLFPL